VIRVELTVRLPNNAGALAGVSKALADEHVNVIAMSLSDSGQLRLVVDRHLHGAAVLRERHYTVIEREVLVVDRATSLTALQLVADAEINLHYAYSGTSALVLCVDDAMRASAATGT
jgi:hypothetical protein